MKFKPFEVVVLGLCLTSAAFGAVTSTEPTKIAPDGKNMDKTLALIVKISPQEELQCPKPYRTYIQPIAPKDFKGPVQAYENLLYIAAPGDNNPQGGLYTVQPAGPDVTVYCLQGIK